MRNTPRETEKMRNRDKIPTQEQGEYSPLEPVKYSI